MVFDVTIIIGTNYTLEYDSSGGIIQKGDEGIESYLVPDNKVGKFTVIKDPVINHVNIYALELYDIPLDIIGFFKANMIKSVMVRIGSGYKNGVKNFDLHRIFIKPAKLLEHAMQKDNIVNDIVIEGISLTSNAILLDGAFGSEMEDMKSYSDAQNISVNKSESTIDYTTTATAVPANSNINVRNFNPGNIVRTNINWAGEVNDGNYSAFEKFATPELGFRALAKNILAKRSQGKTTLAELISVWAPPNENDTNEYIRFVSKATGLNPNSVYSDADIANIAKAMSWIEGDNTTGYYTNDMINSGMKMAGIDSVVTTGSLSKIDYKYGDTTTPITGTNVNRTINMYKNIKGSQILDNILNRMKEKYKIEVAVDGMAGMIKSNFMYKNVVFPGVSTLNLLKTVHHDYPAYYMEVPWILDDMRKADTVNKIGKTWYTEIGILDPNSLPVKSLYDIFDGKRTLIFNNFRADSPRMFYTETPERIEAKTIVFKELPTGIETVFKATKTMEIAQIPDSDLATKDSVSINKIPINTHQLIHIDAAYTAEEFNKRYKVYKNHVYSNPQMVRCFMRCEDPNAIEFGYAYTFDGYGMNKLTPYKIKIELRNVGDKLQADFEVDFYKGITITQQ